jgi:elongation factor Ts
MSNITAAMVKELRERTGAGMMECKKALEAAAGNIETAIEDMRKSGMAKAAKKAGRVAAEGIVALAASSDGRHAALVEVNCETDFVARGDDFINFANQTAKAALAAKAKTLEALQALVFDAANKKTVEEVRSELVAKIGENIQVRRVVYMESTGHLGAYLHGARIGTLVAIDGGNAELAKDIAMHIAASQPQAIQPQDVPADLVAKEKEIFVAQVLESGKPANMVEKIVEGKLNKFLNDMSLVGQPFVKNPDQTVGKLLEQAKAKVVNFVRFEVGEGIEKQTSNFVEEVMAQVKA